MVWTPRIAAKAQTPCWPWELREGGDEHPIGGRCAVCGGEIAVPKSVKGYEAICLYCALANGTLPAVEVPPDDERTLHERAMAERAYQARLTPGDQP